MRDDVQIGLIGLGGISQSQHLPNLTAAKGVSLRAVCDLRPELVQAACARYRVPVGVTDHRALLSDPDIDAVVVATRPENHVEVTLDALRAGKHVYVEKPLAETPEECERVVAAQREAGKLVAVGFNRRAAPAYRKAREILRGHGGAKNIHYRLTDAYHTWGAAFPPGSRVLHEVGHIFDILRFLCDSEVRSVYTVASRPDDEILVLTFSSGCVASIMSSGYVQYDMPKEVLEMVVDLGAVVVTEFIELRTFGLDDCPERICFAGHTHPDHDCTHRQLFEAGNLDAMYQIRRNAYRLHRELAAARKDGAGASRVAAMEAELAHQPLINYMVDKGWQAAHEQFARAIRGVEPLELATAADGLQAARITRAAIESRRTGAVVQLS